jgi:hypothetical protein
MNPLKKLEDSTGIIDYNPEDFGKYTDKEKELLRKTPEGRQILKKAEMLSPEDWKKKYPQYLEPNKELKVLDSLDRKITDKDLFDIDPSAKSRFAKQKAIRNLIKVKDFAKEGLKQAPIPMLLNSEELGFSEMPQDEESIQALQEEMRLKNEPYNRKTRFDLLRQRLGR